MYIPPEKLAKIRQQALQRAQALRREAIDQAWRWVGDVVARAGRAVWSALRRS